MSLAAMYYPYLGMVGFLTSIILLLWTAILVSHHTVKDSSERFWVFIAAIAMNLGTVSAITSLFSLLHPAVWLLTQFLILLITIGLVKYFSAVPCRLLPIESAHKTKGKLSNLNLHVRSLSLITVVPSVLIITLILLSALEQYLVPIYDIRHGDERMYHASRVLYWINNQSIFPYVTHNDRQVVFTFGSELFFLWPLLFVKVELMARMIFWLGYPISVIGLYSILKKLKINTNIVMIGIIIFVTTPLVIRYSTGLKPAMWLIVFVLGTGFWIVQACQNPHESRRNVFFAALFAVLSINVKTIALSLFFVVILLPWVIHIAQGRLAGLISIMCGAVTGFLFSGFVVVFTFNLAIYGHFLGPKALQNVVRSDLSLMQLYTHAVRLPFLLFELPEVPFSHESRRRMGEFGNHIISLLGAARPLPLEENKHWPGHYVYTVPKHANKFSLGGMMWLPLLIIGTVHLVQHTKYSYRNIQLNDLSSLVLLHIPLLFSVVFLARWQSHSLVPERFLLAPYSLGLVISIALLNNIFSKYRIFKYIMFILAIVVVQGALRQQLTTLRADFSLSSSYINSDGLFSEALSYIPPGSHILLFASQNSPDYPLFLPGRGYNNKVTSWGKSSFSNTRMKDLLQSTHTTHVLIQDNKLLSFREGIFINTQAVISFLENYTNYNKIKLLTENMNLFETDKAQDIVQYHREDDIVVRQHPPYSPLIFVASILQDVGIDHYSLKTPWAIRDLGPAEQGFTWLGYGAEEGLRFVLWSRDSRDVILKFAVSPGPSRTDLVRTVELLQGKTMHRVRRTFTETTSLVFTVSLMPGQNIFHFIVLDTSTVPIQPNGDTRRLLVGLHQVAVDPLP